MNDLFIFLKWSLVSLSLFVSGWVGHVAPMGATAEAQQYSPGGDKEKSWTESISSGFKQGVDKLGRIVKPKSPDRAYSRKDDPVSLSNKAKPGPELHVAVARLHEQSGRTADAAEQYVAALKLKPDYLPALLGYARLLERQGRTDLAVALYQRAASVKAAPDEIAPAYNNLGLCLSRAGRSDEALAAMIEAVKLAPKNPLYRNNIAALLVNCNRRGEAFGHLMAVHGEAAAYYNMGYLLYKNGHVQAAYQHFAMALRADSSLAQARQWLDFLQRETALAQQTQTGSHVGMGGKKPQSAVSQDAAPQNDRKPRQNDGEIAPLPSTSPNRPPSDSPRTARRLPPTEPDESALDAPPMPAPSRQAVRPLPQVK